jgi:periplasmic divalent cation tolerance protein
MTDCFLLYVTASNCEEARVLGRTAVQERLAACANVVGKIESFYHWDGKLEEGEESLLILKTHALRLESLTRRLRALHSYACPAIVAVPITGGNPEFLRWVQREVDEQLPEE